MDLREFRDFLDQRGLNYEWLRHSKAHSAQSLALKENMPADQVIKPVLVKIDGEFVLCALPASHRVDLDRLQLELGAEETSLADESDLSALFENCELGAEPPIGWLFGLPTLMDESVFDDGTVTFQAGTHTDAVTMKVMDYYRLAKPVIGHFGRQA
jgi:Ala-tRNA(Pro) deacylase